MTIARNTLLLVLLLAFPPGVARAQLIWQKSAANPIVRTFEPMVRMTLAAEPCVLTDSVTGLRRMWFSASGSPSGTNRSITLALSEDGDHWHVYERSPVLSGGAGGFDSRGILHGEVIRDARGYKMYYTGDNGTRLAIGLATSSDGYVWTKHPANPVLAWGPPGSWDELAACFPQVIYDGSTYAMWFGGFNATSSATGFATSEDGVTWTRHPANPILRPGLPGLWDDRGASVAGIARRSGMYSMLYRGNNFSSPAVAIGLAISPDGITWEKHPSNPVLRPGAASEWDGSQLTGASLEVTQSGFVFWYAGSPGSSNWQIGRATAPFMSLAVEPVRGGAVMPAGPTLEAFPNPANPSVSIHYSLPSDGPVQIEMIDVNGRAMATVVNGRQAAGTHTVAWNSGNFSSGVYFCRLRAGGETRISKIVITR